MNSTSVALRNHGATERLVLRMIAVARIEGVVLDEEGRPMQGVMIYTSFSLRATTDAAGRYEIENLDPGKYTIALRVPFALRRETLKRDANTGEMFGYPNTSYYPGVADAQAATTVAITGGLELRGFDMRLRRTRLVDFSGRVVESAGGSPVAGARVELIAPGGALQDETVKLRPVGADGDFRFDLIQPGPHTLLVYRSGGPRALPWRSPVEVSKAGVQDLKVVLPVFPSLQGTIASPPDTEWIGQVIFTFTMPAQAEFAVHTPNFTLDEIPPGQWNLRVEAIASTGEGTKLFLQSARMGAQDLLTGPLTVVESGNPPLELRLTAESGHIAGTVVDEDGAPVKNAIVLISRGNGLPMGLQGTGWTDASGVMKIDGLPAGSYVLRVVQQGRSVSPREETKVEVRLGETSVVRITVPKQ